MNLKDLYNQVQTKKSVDLKLAELYHQKEVLESRKQELADKMIKEQRDVEGLENSTLKAFFLELRGDFKTRLDKEKQEAYEAKAKYEAANYQLQVVYEEIEKNEQILESVKDCEALYEEAYKKEEEILKESHKGIIFLEERKITSLSLQREIREAINAGEAALKIANEVKNELLSADGWASWDALGGGMFVDMMKYSFLDEAEYQIQRLQTQLGRYKTELADVKVNAQIDVSIDEFLRFADYFFDNIFTDFTVLDKIEKALKQINETIDDINHIQDILNDLIIKEKDVISRIDERIEKIVIEEA